MTKSISAQGFTLDSDQTALINKKLERISYAENLIVDLIMQVKEYKKFYFAAALNKMMDVLDTKIKKEKDKVQEKK